jgi:cytoskeleton protein RodZ
MAAVGAYLRELRVKRGLSIDELARVTRVAPRYLDALENDAFDSLPAPVFTRGFIRAYCQAVGASPEEVLARYDGREAPAAAAATPASARAPRSSSPTVAADGEPRGRSAILVSFVLLVVLGVALFAVALVTQPAREQRVERTAPPPAEPTAPPVASITAAPEVSTRPIPAPTPKPAAPRAPEPARPAPPPPPAAAPPQFSNFGATPAAPVPPVVGSAPTGPRSWMPQVQTATTGLSTPYRLVARVSEPTWIRVRTEDGRTTEETVPAGAVREWVSNRPFVITIGNAGGVSFELNGRALPAFGPSGAVISGIVLPPEGARPP